MKSLFSLINPIKKTKDIHDEKANEIKTYPKKSIQDNKKKITNRYQEMIKNDKKLIAKPEALKEIKSIDWKNIPSKSENASLEMGEDEKEFNQFLNEVQNHQKFLRNDENHVLRCFGITKSPGDDIEITKWLKDESSCSKKRPKSNSYIMVMKWANDRDSLNYIENKVYDEKFTWYRRLEILEELS
ncbi:hypothetical protein RhiirC2_871545, partial [Rhizophagus irregularis]